MSQQVNEQDWKTLRALVYHASAEEFEVPVHSGTDFASVPRVFVWFIPRYGRYTKAAILHDYLCRVEVPARRISRIDADGIFRQAMRELGVPFLRRWIMWAAVRLGALTDQAGRKNWWKEAWRVALIAGPRPAGRGPGRSPHRDYASRLLRRRVPGLAPALGRSPVPGTPGQARQAGQPAGISLAALGTPSTGECGQLSGRRRSGNA